MSIRIQAPDGMQRYIQEVCPRYFISWNQLKDRWEAQAWTIRPHFKPSPYKIEKWIREGRESYLIRRCFREDEGGRDIGYKPLDFRFIRANKIGVYNLQQVKKLLAILDDHNARMSESIDEQEDYEHRAAAKAVYKHFREPSVYMRGY